MAPLPLPITEAKNVGVVFDTSLSFDTQAKRIVSSCFLTIKILRKVFPFIPTKLRVAVVDVFITSCIDYCNALHLNINRGTLNKLQMIQNEAARLVLDVPEHLSIRDGIHSLHWLPVIKCVQFKDLCVVHTALHC